MRPRLRGSGGIECPIEIKPLAFSDGNDMEALLRTQESRITRADGATNRTRHSRFRIMNIRIAEMDNGMNNKQGGRDGPRSAVILAIATAVRLNDGSFLLNFEDGVGR